LIRPVQRASGHPSSRPADIIQRIFGVAGNAANSAAFCRPAGTSFLVAYFTKRRVWSPPFWRERKTV
jgi:hypothetical protein